jgi:hypothetical protein
MIMAILIKTVMSGLIASSALAVVGAPASVALAPKDLAFQQAQQVQAVKTAQRIDNMLPVQEAVWSQQDQQKFWEEGEDRGG